MSEMNKCERAEELIGYLYGETDASARRSFEQHLSACGACRDELAAFGAVREVVGEWRAEVAERLPALAPTDLLPHYARNGRPAAPEAQTAGAQHETQNGVAPLAAHAHLASQHAHGGGAPRRSALAALREFFTLTPAWARAGLVAASLLVCALVALAVLNAELRWENGGVAFKTRLSGEPSRTQPAAPAHVAPQVASVDQARYTQADVDRLAAERDAAQRELAAIREQLDASQQSVATLNASLKTARDAQRQTVQFSQRTPRAGQASPARRGVSNAPQLARNPVEPDDDGLNLSDLLTEVSAGGNLPPGKRE
jgi:anti-sigma factor RsiW